MSDPQTPDEYQARYVAAARISGHGVGGTTMHVPCPFCCAPDVLTHTVLDTEDAYRRGAVCGSCGRGFRAVFTKDEPHRGATTISFVQTCGDDPPSFIAESIPREVTS